MKKIKLNPEEEKWLYNELIKKEAIDYANEYCKFENKFEIDQKIFKSFDLFFDEEQEMNDEFHYPVGWFDGNYYFNGQTYFQECDDDVQFFNSERKWSDIVEDDD